MRNRYGWMAASLVLTCSLLLAACNSNTNVAGTSPANDAASSNEGGQASAPSPAPENADDRYFGKYDPPITVETVRIINDTYKFEEGESMNDNVWTEELRNTLGIQLENKWVVSGDEPGGQGEQKMNVSIASGDLADFMPLNAKQLKQLAEADKLMDLTELYEQYASPLMKQIMEEAGPSALASATFGGKLMAIPATSSMIDGAPMIWIRYDWMQKLNLEPPRRMDDVFAIMDAFVTQDPDGNGLDDTYGMALQKDLYGGYAGLEGFFNSYHAYPRWRGIGHWMDDGSGNLVFGSIQPEVKTALAKLQELYNKGYIDREFGVKDAAKERELEIAGKIGLHFGNMSNSLNLRDHRTNDPNADWRAFPLASVDDKPARPQVVGVALGNPQYFAVTKDAANPEALFKMMNLQLEVSYGPDFPREEYMRLNHGGGNGIETWKYHPFVAQPAQKNLTAHKKIVEALESGDPSKLNSEERGYYDSIVRNEAGTGDANDWGFDRVFGREGAFSVVNRYVTEELLAPSAFYVAPTETMAEKDSTLQKLELEVFSKIIMGEDLSAFDEFVKNWKALGGDPITQEVNEWNRTK